MPAKIFGKISTQVRLDEHIWKKLKVIAKNENRSANSQLDYFMKKGVEAYEEEHGPISLPDEP